MNQDTNRPVRHEQEMERDMYGYEIRQQLPQHYGHHSQPYEPYPARREAQRKKPWHSQGWFWLIVTVAGIGVLLFGLLMLSEELGGIRTALQEQTDVLRAQNGLLNSLGDQVEHLTAAVNRVADAVRDAVSHWLASM